jgi:hypothetical protein
MIAIEKSKLEETLTEIANKMKNDEAIDFEYTGPFGETKKGKIKKIEDKIKIELPENSYPNIVVNALSNPGFNYTVIGEGSTFNYDSSKNILECFTSEDTNMKNLTANGMENFWNFENLKFKYFNTDLNGLVTGTVVNGQKIEEINFKDFHYHCNMDNSVLASELKKLKFNEISMLHEILSSGILEFDKTFYNLNKELEETVSFQKDELAFELFRYDYENHDTVKIKKIPENYSDKDIASSIAAYIEGDEDLTINLEEDQADLVKRLISHTEELNERGAVNFTFDLPKQIIFSLQEDNVYISFEKDFETNFKKSYDIIDMYKSNLVDEKSNVSTTIFDKEGDILITDNCLDDDGKKKENSFAYFSPKKIEKEDIEKAQMISSYEGKNFLLSDKTNGNQFLISKNFLEFKLRDQKYNELSIPQKMNFLKEYTEKNGFDKIFEKIRSDGLNIKGGSIADNKVKNFEEKIR